MITDIINAESNLKATDRVLKLKVKDGTKAKSSTGLVDTRLFTGEQDIHLKMDLQSNLWSFQYSSNGLLPEGLKGQFTTFSKGYDHAVQYFGKRNIEITEVRD